MSNPTSTPLNDPPPPVDFVFEPRVLEITRERQRHKLALCGIDPDVWGDAGDPTFLGVYAIMAQVWSGRSINGNVHMSQVFRLNKALPLDQPITMAGEVSRIEPHPRGQRVFADFAFALNDGTVPLRASRSSLNPGPGAPNAQRVSTPDDPLAGMSQISEMQLVPENVASFSDEANNLIHSDPATAQHFGFRAPIAGGLMASHIMLGALINEAGRRAGISGLDMEISFLRPMFWDERLRIMGTPVGAPGPRRLAVVGDDGKPKNLHIVNSIAFA